MADLRFESVNLALGEPNPHLRQSLKLALSARGLTKITDCHSMETVEQMLCSDVLDVMICDVEMQGGDFCDAIHRMRHHRLGRNPFVVVIGTTSLAQKQLVRRVIDCGVDDLLLKPLSVEMVLDRLSVLARARKPFVVTHDYIGPDRRKGLRTDEEQGTELIEVPNTLRGKTLDGVAVSDLQRAIDQSAARLNDHKMHRYSVQVGFLVKRITANRGKSEMGDIYADDCERLLYVGEDLSRRLRGTGFGHVGELAATLTSLVGRFRPPGTPPSDVDIELLGKLALAIRRAFSPEQDNVAAAKQISDTISDFARGHGKT